MTGVGYSGGVLPHTPPREGIKREVNKLKYREEPAKGGTENELYPNPYPPSQSKGHEEGIKWQSYLLNQL